MPTPPPNPPHIRLERNTLKGRALGEIVIDRPEKCNALTPAMLEAMVRGAQQLADDPAVQAIVVRSEGETFCAGFDLSLCHADGTALPALLRSLSKFISVLRSAPKPVVIGVQGAAVAGAAAMLAGADLVVAEAAAKIGYPVVRLGISPAVSGPTLAGAIGIGPARTRQLNPELIDAQHAHRLGWVHVLVPVVEDVQPRAQIEAAKLADKPPHAYAQTKAWLNTIDTSATANAQAAGLAASLALAGNEEQRALLARALGR